MFKTTLMAVLCAGVASATQVSHTVVLTNQRESSTCGATAIGKHALLSAAHCFKADLPFMFVDGRQVALRSAIDDHNDHIIYLIEGIAFGKFIPLTPAPVKKGDEVEYTDYQGYKKKGVVTAFGLQGPRHVTIVEADVRQGDSGSGVFDGPRLIGTVNFMYKTVPRNAFMYFFAFTPDEISKAQEF